MLEFAGQRAERVQPAREVGRGPPLLQLSLSLAHDWLKLQKGLLLVVTVSRDDPGLE